MELRGAETLTCDGTSLQRKHISVVYTDITSVLFIKVQLAACFYAMIRNQNKRLMSRVAPDWSANVTPLCCFHSGNQSPWKQITIM